MDFEDITKRIESLKAKKSRAEGRLEQQMSELKEKFGFESVEEAEQGLADLQKQRDASQQELKDATVAFIEKWGDRLNEY